MRQPLPVLNSMPPQRAPVEPAEPGHDAAADATWSAATAAAGAEAVANGAAEVSPRHDELMAAGWQRRFVAAEPRLREMTELYEALGHDVLHESASDALPAVGCAGCTPARAIFRIIYTRKQP